MNLTSFIAHAVKLEHDAEEIYRKSAEVIDQTENEDAVEFFREMATYASQHLQEIKHRGGISDISELPQSGYVWADAASPESIAPSPAAGDIIDLEGAMTSALNAERRAVVFYTEVANSSSEPEVRELAETFAAEECEHVLALERFMGRRPY